MVTKIKKSEDSLNFSAYFIVMKGIVRLSGLTRWLLWTGFILLVLFTLMRFGLYLFFNKQGHSLGELGSVFLLGLGYDLRTISLVLVFMLLAGSLRLLHPFSARGKRFWTIFLYIVVFVLLFLFAVDFAHYAYLVQRLNAGVLGYLEDTGISLNMVWQSYPVIRLVLGLMAATWMVMWFIRRAWTRVNNRPQQAGQSAQSMGFAACLLVPGFFLFGPVHWSDAFTLGSDYKANLALNPFESFVHTLKRRTTYDGQRVKELYPVIARYYHLPEQNGLLNYERKVAPRDSSFITTPNVVLVICESFSAYKSSMWGNPLNTTPFFDSLSREGLFFDRCFAPAYSTSRGVWATLTGIPDVESPSSASRNPNAEDQHSIINDFAGYEKFYFIGGSASWGNTRGVLTENIAGLHLYEGDDFKLPFIDVWGISDKNLFLESNKVLARQSKPFFAVIQTADNHRPYTIPQEDLQAFTPVNIPLDSLRRHGFESLEELNAFRYTDFCYRQFFEAARKEKYFDNTIFVFVGDHGIPGNAGSLLPAVWTNQRLTAMHVPLLFYGPGFVAPRRSDMICSQVDVLPTIAGVARIAYTNSTLGKDLLDPATHPFAFIFDPDNNFSGVVKGDYYYRHQQQTGNEHLFSIAGNSLPGNDSSAAVLKGEMRMLTEALYETAKYLLLNNKKKR